MGYKTLSPPPRDISSHWARESIDFVLARGVMKTVSSRVFDPGGDVTRAELAAILGQFSGAGVSSYKKSSYTDVKTGSSAMPYIEWAKKNALFVQLDSTKKKFYPDRAVSRQEFAVVLANFARASGFSLPKTLVYPGVDGAVGRWAQASVWAVQSAGVMFTKTGGQFYPDSNVTRAEVAAALYRYVQITIDPSTALGFSSDDEGQLVYHDTRGSKILPAKYANGKKYFNIGGKMYDADGPGVRAVKK